jgi:hypothetical protein
MYAHAPHGGLKGKSPFQVAAESATPIRTIHERALDVLLMPVAGKNGIRRMTKFGIRIDHHHYSCAAILPGTDVFVRRDPNDMGRIHAFTPDQGTYLGEAICPDLAGIHPQTFYASEKEMRSEIIAEKTAEIRKGIREIKKGPALYERALRNAARKIPNVVAMPKREERHETPQIAAALDVGREASSAPLPEGAADLHAQILADLSPKAPGGNVTPLRNGPTPAQRFRQALSIEARIQAHEPVESEETLWLLSYRDSAEYKVQRTLFEDFGDQAPG